MTKKTLTIVLLCFTVLGLNAQTYKIMTYNIRYDNPNDGENQWSKRKAVLSNQILFYEPDIIGIQEGLHHQVTYLDSMLVNYKYIGVGRDDGKTKGEYSAIFYNANKLKVIQNQTFWLSDTPKNISVGWDASMERICTYALFKDLKTKQHFWVFNTHFDHIGKMARAQSAKLIVKTITDLNDNNPVILTGDFNLKPESEPIQFLSKAMNDAKTVSIATPFGPEGTYNGFKFEEPVKNRIDYIFTSKNTIEVKKFAILSNPKNGKYPSDHLPVYIEMLIQNN
ncbi:endonuclease/exonuclease/phosphatase family protein [Aestuariivivens insulae]|uniref:endonuclease/exonuclease/phosphatase family protein n=1 Tax=Aestuariivivens insulae TaxID=1621988 RepID=UPI001F5625BF|nr:endonuclease/exonuclease/phosphatase family protein [Aestuariivivens insulae]